MCFVFKASLLSSESLPMNYPVHNYLNQVPQRFHELPRVELRVRLCRPQQHLLQVQCEIQPHKGYNRCKTSHYWLWKQQNLHPTSNRESGGRTFKSWHWPSCPLMPTCDMRVFEQWDLTSHKFLNQFWLMYETIHGITIENCLAGEDPNEWFQLVCVVHDMCLGLNSHA